MSCFKCIIWQTGVAWLVQRHDGDDRFNVTLTKDHTMAGKTCCDVILMFKTHVTYIFSGGNKHDIRLNCF
ncbi:hypothetical protein SAMN05428978_1003112 [Nitrosomonas sp. Nm34]|nr:hypothetical protein SAMN05428978_1003112 [Nitrosomonas sp. Nm34]